MAGELDWKEAGRQLSREIYRSRVLEKQRPKDLARRTNEGEVGGRKIGQSQAQLGINKDQKGVILSYRILSGFGALLI